MEDLEEKSKENARDTSFSEETVQPLGYVPQALRIMLKSCFQVLKQKKYKIFLLQG